MTVAVPRHAPNVQLRQDGEATLLVVLPDDAGVVLDPTALALWELCDGETTVQEMTLAVCALYDATPETVEPDITGVLVRLEAAGLLEWVSR